MDYSKRNYYLIKTPADSYDFWHRVFSSIPTLEFHHPYNHYKDRKTNKWISVKDYDGKHFYGFHPQEMISVDKKYSNEFEREFRRCVQFGFKDTEETKFFIRITKELLGQ